MQQELELQVDSPLLNLGLHVTTGKNEEAQPLTPLYPKTVQV